MIDCKEVVRLWGERGRIDNEEAAGQLPGIRKGRELQRLAARTKSEGRGTEAISLEEKLGEFHLSGGGGYETVDEEMGDTPRLEEEEDNPLAETDDNPGTESNQRVGLEGLVW